jgi:copper transport protein
MTRTIPTRRAWRRWIPGGLAVAALSVLLVGVAATPASAHADVERASPGAGAVLDRSPRTVKIWFTEAVDVRLGGMWVYDQRGARVATGKLRQPRPDRLVLPLERALDDGSYIVTWRAVSEDAHPIQGTWTFQVGDVATAPGDVDALADRLLAGQEADRSVAIGWAAARWTVLAAIALLVGGAVFGAVIWPPARDQRATRRVVTIGWIALSASTVVGAFLFGAYSRGGTLADAFDLGVLRDTLDTRFGIIWSGRLVLLLVSLALLRVLFACRPARERALPAWWLPVAAAVGVGLVSSPGLAGHASTGDHRVLALVTDAVHVGAMAIWLGGLVVLVSAVVSRSGPDDLRVVLSRFSRVAMICIASLVVTGAFQTWRLVGGLDALRDSEFGRILVIKLVAFAVLLAVATLSHEIVGRVLGIAAGTERVAVPAVRGAADGLDDPPGSAGPPSPDQGAQELRALKRSVWAEVALGAAVLLVTALLVNAAPPADRAAAIDTAAGVTIESRRVTLDITATPGTAGVNDVHVNTYSRAGTLLRVDAVEMSIAFPARDIAPLSVPLRELGPGHYFSPGLDIPLSGTWKVQVTVRLGPVDRVDLSGDLEIR